ncbi:class II myosin [Batrachochytrium dendrobatidis]
MASQYLERVRQNAVNDTLEQAQWSERKWVWIVDKEKGYIQGSIIKENGDEVEVQLDDNSVSVLCAAV